MSKPPSSPLRTSTRVRITRHRGSSEADPSAKEEPETTSQDVPNAEPLAVETKPVVTPAQSTPNKRPDPAITQALRPILDGIYELRDEEYVVVIAILKTRLGC